MPGGPIGLLDYHYPVAPDDWLVNGHGIGMVASVYTAVGWECSLRIKLRGGLCIRGSA